MSPEEVSIITPCFNGLQFLDQTVDSVLKQSFLDWKLYLVDDGSTDGSAVWIQNKAKEDARIIPLLLEQNVGVAKARNLALEKAKGRYIVYLDSDDLWDEDFLALSLKFLKDNQYQMVYSGYRRLSEDLQAKLPDFLGPEKVNYQRLLYNCPLSMLTTLYDTHKVGKIYIPEDVDKREDHALWFLVLSKIQYAYNTGQVLASYRMRENSYSRNKLEIAYKQFLVYDKFLHLPLYKSLFYTISWALNGFLKYGKV